MTNFNYISKINILFVFFLKKKREKGHISIRKGGLGFGSNFLIIHKGLKFKMSIHNVEKKKID